MVKAATTLALAASAALTAAHIVADAGCTSTRRSLGKRQDGGITGPTTSSDSLHYNCDPNACKLPACNCASTSPPGGLTKEQVPQFVLFTADDAVQIYTINAINKVLSGRKNPNGCPVTMTYFTSIQYTNMSLVTDWYVAGNDIADHTMTHVGDPDDAEIIGNAAALNAFAGIPQSALTGFRAPFLNYTIDMLQRVSNAEFTYDSSSTSSVKSTDPNTDAWWPYTLDHGLANDCLAQACGDSGTKIKGLWEVPMAAVFDANGDPHLMDPWLDAQDMGNTTLALDWMKNSFTDHYANANRQPFGVYTHPVHWADDIPGQAAQPEVVRVINEFLDWVQTQQDVWLVSNAQLIAWMQNPVPASQLNTLKEFQCNAPQVDGQVCNGIPANEMGLLETCPFSDFPWNTCYGCPVRQPSPNEPTPEQDTTKGTRYRLPSNCSTPFFDPIANKCLCTSDSCKFDDVTKPIGPNGANLTSGGTGTDSSDASTTTSDPYVPFNGGSTMRLSVALAAVGATVAAWVML